MNTLEPLCTGEQTEMLQQLGLNVLIDPTISLAKNWLYEKYGLWINTIYVKGEKVMSYTSFVEFGSIKIKNTTYSDNPHTAESDCLTEVLKKLTNEKSNS